VSPKIKVNPRDNLAYRLIAAGRFMMGCSTGDRECKDDEKPIHHVNISEDFWIGQTLVTQAAYREVTGKKPSHFHGDRLPVEQVSWADAEKYCNAIGGRLPTEAEWEYAARGGNAGPIYGPIKGIAWYLGTVTNGKTQPVGQKQPNDFGLFDMLGNVSEWTGDWYSAGYYSTSGDMDPSGYHPGKNPPLEWSQVAPIVLPLPLRTAGRSVRGGSYLSGNKDLRVSRRQKVTPTEKIDTIGFRCVWQAN
jgi:formylglycine-generating enzyme required for sulfatase activity